jgi:hypothetical protein
VQAALTLLVVVLSQLAFWALLRAGFFVTALGANVVFWCAAFPAWIAAGRRWWTSAAAVDTLLAFMLIATAAIGFAFAGADLPAATQNAWFWVGMFEVPVALIAATLATLRTRALRRAAASGPRPMTALIIAAVILSVALAVFAFLVLVNVGGSR